MELLARLLVSAAMLTVPFGVLALLTGKANGLVWLMIPFIGLVPLFLVAAVLLFIPIEKLALAQGWAPLPGLLVAGGVIGTLVVVLADYFGKKKTALLTDIASGNLTVIGATFGLVALGVAMGAVWHFSRSALAHFGSA
jgi:hypothetical protein